MDVIEHALTNTDFETNPYALYPLLHAHDAVYWSDAWQCWMVSKYEHVLDVLHQPNRFSNEDRVTTLLNTLPENQRGEFRILQQHFGTGMVHSDPPKHTRLRKLATYAFTPRIVKNLRPRIESLVNEAIDKALTTGQFELISDLAYPLPATVIAEMLGVPREDQDKFKAWSSALGILGGKGTATLETFRMVQDNIHAMREYLRGLLHQRRLHPQDDLLTLYALCEIIDQTVLKKSEYQYQT